MNPNQIPDPRNTQPRVRLEDTTEVTCDNCSHNVFAIGSYMRKVSALLSGTGNTAYIPIENAVYCVKCHHTNEEFIPDGLVKKSILQK